MFLLMARPRLCPFVEHWPRRVIDLDNQECLLRNKQTFVDMTKAATKPPPLRTRSLPPRSLCDAEASDAGQKREEDHDVETITVHSAFTGDEMCQTRAHEDDRHSEVAAVLGLPPETFKLVPSTSTSLALVRCARVHASFFLKFDGRVHQIAGASGYFNTDETLQDVFDSFDTKPGVGVRSDDGPSEVLWSFICDSGYDEDEHVLFHRGEALLEDIDCGDWVAPPCELADIYDGEPTSNLHFLFEHDDDALICLLIFHTWK